jgi:beta-lactamase superfamily II metal-dependent hydrolase
MYNIGFGDCVLLTFPAPERPRKILIDCGVHFMGRNKEQPFDEVLNQLIEDIKEDGVPTLDLVIATHRHQDHVSGFANEVWNDVDVREVWMPWTENYEDKQAVEILLFAKQQG